MQLRNFLVLALIFTSALFAYSQNAIDSIYKVEHFNRERYKMVQKNTKEATSYFKNSAAYYLEKGDTIHHLLSIAHLSDIKHRQGRFNQAFDLLWEGLPLATNISNKMPLLEFHQMLGILYQVYGKDSIALSHTKQGLQISKEYAIKDDKYKSRLVSCYLDVAIQYEAMKNYNQALLYLDSCYAHDSSGKRLHFVDGVYGQVYLAKKDYKKAKQYLKGVIPFLEERGNGFQTSANYFFGKLKWELNQTDSAIYYYQKSLSAIDSLQNNLKLKPAVLQDLAFVYSKINLNKKAFECMQEAKLLTDSLFTTQSQQNKALFEIKNKYKEDLIQKEQELSSQNQLLKISNEARFRLRLLIGVLMFLAVIAFFSFRMKVKMKKITYEKSLNEEKNQAILEVKNKELTAHALQIIEKEQTVKELLETILVKSPETHNSLQRKYKQSNKKIWEDFHLRFTQTNDQFYKRLLDLHPELTPTDLKHCALIKLNFDSKEMSHLLGISINSVHMARSRIRKKLGLNREDSLSNYLGKI
ncbi:MULTISPECIES: hypothetical protein [unclassified Saccharicrinis]|uniref:hypothetical protein n=1 Tax=unclassified Saccharicrinis TaxID=2646859 RepID=UPI003D34582B